MEKTAQLTRVWDEEDEWAERMSGIKRGRQAEKRILYRTAMKHLDDCQALIALFSK